MCVAPRWAVAAGMRSSNYCLVSGMLLVGCRCWHAARAEDQAPACHRWRAGVCSAACCIGANFLTGNPGHEVLAVVRGGGGGVLYSRR